jgi:DNA-binding CsgD family transcriptional regulator
VLVGRSDVLDHLTDLCASAGSGELAVVVLEGEAGIGKTALAEMAQRNAAEQGWITAWVQGVQTDAALAHGGLAELLTALRSYLTELPDPQQSILTSSVGRSAHGVDGDRFQVAAATLALLAQVSESAPLLVVIDDEQWLDAESAEAIIFAARRLRHDRVAFILTRRSEEASPHDLAGLATYQLTGLAEHDVGELLGAAYSPTVVSVLTRETGGNPLALLESARTLTPLQRAGAEELPPALAVPERLVRLYERELSRLSPGAAFAVRLAAASFDLASGPVVGALTNAELDAAACFKEVSQVLQLRGAALVFRHPLLRSIAWQRADSAERREAHAALALTVPAGPARTWHRAEAVIGYDDNLARELAASADAARFRRGYAGASAAYEQAARMVADGTEAARYFAAAVEDAFLAGDGVRAQRLSQHVLTHSSESDSRARVLVVSGILEQHTGTFVQARSLFFEAAEIARGRLLIRALTELASVCYLLDDRVGMTAAAEQADREADSADPEQSMLAAYLGGAALVFAGHQEQAVPLITRALELLETEPTLRNDPRHLSVALLCARWLLDPSFVVGGLTMVQIGLRRIAVARELGALGALALGLSIAASGLAWIGDHLQAYAFAGEAVELLDVLGYAGEPGIAHETLAMECAARGRYRESTEMLRRGEDVMHRSGLSTLQPHLAHAMISCALSEGNLRRVVTLGEEELREHAGAGVLLEPLGVAPPLIEAYVGLGRTEDARLLAERYTAANVDSSHPYLLGSVARCQGLIADDLDSLTDAFERAIAAQLRVGDRAEVGRTRLLYGMRLRRMGARIAAREQLRKGIEDFAAIDFQAWQERAEAELATTGERARSRKHPAGSALSSQETRVALLVARGMTNREVATALFLSPRTVEHHLGSVLRKRGLRSRTELARDLAHGNASEEVVFTD